MLFWITPVFSARQGRAVENVKGEWTPLRGSPKPHIGGRRNPNVGTGLWHQGLWHFSEGPLRACGIGKQSDMWLSWALQDVQHPWPLVLCASHGLQSQRPLEKLPHALAHSKCSLDWGTNLSHWEMLVPVIIPKMFSFSESITKC